jgi:hypothetical protein
MASYPVGTGALTKGLKGLGREADHSRPFSAEGKNTWSHTSISPICINVSVFN